MNNRRHLRLAWRLYVENQIPYDNPSPNNRYIARRQERATRRE